MKHMWFMYVYSCVIRTKTGYNNFVGCGLPECIFTFFDARILQSLSCGSNNRHVKTSIKRHCVID